MRHVVQVGTAAALAAIMSSVVPLATAAGQQRLDAGPVVTGRLPLPGLSAPVTVQRDAHGIPYVTATNMADLIRAQGFVTAQNRLFQMEFYRLSTQGRLAEVLGEAGLANDREMRTVGIRRNAMRHAARLSPRARRFIGWYVEGVNAYLAGQRADHPAELKLLGLAPQPWTVTDVMTILHFANWSQAANYKAELLMQALIDRFGAEKVNAELLPILSNPDRAVPDATARIAAAQPLDLARGRLAFAPGSAGQALAVGSNNWAIAPQRSASGAAMVVNDPHLDARALPGPWAPVGLHAPGIQAVGVALPGVPGLLIGRNAHVAFGVTNAYGDSQDLFIETPVPGNPDAVMDGGRAVPLGRIEEVIRVRDGSGGFREERLVIRTTPRGPVVADGLAGGAMLSLRTAAAEVKGGELGFDRLLTARRIADVDRAVQAMDILYFNYVFGDTAGGIGFRASGRVPVRSSGHGSVPQPASARWLGTIPPARMPGLINPARGWLGTANHDTRDDAMAGYYTSYASPDYRYRRMAEVLGNATAMTVAGHNDLMRDTRNLQAPALLPALVAALAEGDHADLARILAGWNGHDDATGAAPLIYHRLYEQVALETFVDDMGEPLARDYLKQYYVWQQRFDRMAAQPDNGWFDDVRTAQRETLPDLVRRAAGVVRAQLAAAHGPDPAAWRWGAEHRIHFFSLLRPTGPERDAFGFAERAMDGSGETLMRARTAFQGSTVEFFASMRFVADLGDATRVQAVLSGGAVDRQFHPHQKDQLPAWSEGQLLDWWLSPDAISRNAVATQILTDQ